MVKTNEWEKYGVSERDWKIYLEYENFGKKKGSPVSFATLGKKYGISRTRVLQVYEKVSYKKLLIDSQ